MPESLTTLPEAIARLRSLRSAVLLLCGILLVFWGSARETFTQSATFSYGITDLGTLGGATSAALGIETGPFPAVVGYAADAGGNVHAFRGKADRLVDLGTLGGARSEAWAAAQGFVVGRSQVAGGAYHAFFYSYYQPMTDIGTLGGTQSYATGINAYTTTVGASYLAGDTVLRAFIYDGSAMSPLGASLGGPNTAAYAINDAGAIVGRADLPGGATSHAFLYENGGTTDLGSLGTNSEALGINESGVIVGRSQLANGQQHAFRYEGGAMQDLGTLGGAASEALAVNAAGTIVGWALTAGGARHAFIWSGGTMTDLNSLVPPGTGWVIESATGIGATAIAAYGTRNGQRHALLLKPAVDLSLDLHLHRSMLDTNIPKPHEAGRILTWGVTLSAQYEYDTNGQGTNDNGISGATIVDTISGPVEYVGWSGDGECTQSGQQMTCRFDPFDFDAEFFFNVRATDAGAIHHSATIVASDPPDPNPANNSGAESNTAVSLASFTLNPTTFVGGKSSLGRATLTSPCPSGGASVRLTSSRPDVATVPSQFDVLPWSNGGLWREFYVKTTTVTQPVTVQISASYGLNAITVPITVMPARYQFTYGGTPRGVPGTIQAEDFDEGGEGVSYHDTTAGNAGSNAYRASDVDLQATTDTGGGSNVAWIAAGEWLEYTVNVAAAGTYDLSVRVAANGPGGTFHLEANGVDKTGPLVIPNTVGWQNWTNVTKTGVSLAAGQQIIRIAIDRAGSTGVVGNINYFRLNASTVSTPFHGTPRALPGTLQAEDFDEGGELVAYHDSTSGNSGGAYRTSNVDVQATADAGGGYNVGWITAGEWLNYTVAVGATGAYDLSVRVAANGPGGTFHIEVAGRDVTGPLTIPNTGGWQTWTSVTRSGVTLGAGQQVWRVVIDSAGSTGIVGNINYIRVTSKASTPFGGVPWAVPGTVQAEDFDEGGEGVAYHDATTGNSGGAYRPTRVDIQATADTGGGYNVGWVVAGEWLNYTVNVGVAGTYTISTRVAANGTGGTFHIEVNGVDKTGPLTVPNTGGWQQWVTVAKSGVSLGAGQQVWRLVVDAAGPTGAVGNFNYVRVTAGP